LFFQESGKICLVVEEAQEVLQMAAMQIRVEEAVQEVAAPIISAIRLVHLISRRNKNPAVRPRSSEV
jgi:hypothetical protein